MNNTTELKNTQTILENAQTIMHQENIRLLDKIQQLHQQLVELVAKNEELNKRIKWLELPSCGIEDQELIDYYYDNFVVEE